MLIPPSASATTKSCSAPRPAAGRSAAARSRIVRPAALADLAQELVELAKYAFRSERGSVSTSGSPSSPLNSVVLRKGKSSSAGSRTWNTMTSCRRWRKCFRPASIAAHVVEQVAEDDHHAPLLEPLGQVVEDRPGGRLPLAGATAPSRAAAASGATGCRWAARSARSWLSNVARPTRPAAAGPGRPATPRRTGRIRASIAAVASLWYAMLSLVSSTRYARRGSSPPRTA